MQVAYWVLYAITKNEILVADLRQGLRIGEEKICLDNGEVKLEDLGSQRLQGDQGGDFFTYNAHSPWDCPKSIRAAINTPTCY